MPKSALQSRKVQCWIFSKQKNHTEPHCLLLKTNQQRGSFWQPVTGSVEPGESYFEAAYREPVEETGFTFTTPPLDTSYEFTFNGNTQERVFALIVEGMPKPTLDPKEHQDYQWTKPLEALSLLRYPSNVEGLKHSYQLFFGKELA